MNNPEHTFRALMLVCGIIIIIASFGCSSDSGIGRQYAAEKKLHQAMKLQKKVMINPRIASTADYSQAIRAYMAVVKEFPARELGEHIDNLRKRAYISLADLYVLQGEFRQAIKVYDGFIAEYPEDKDYRLLVHFANAKSNERIFNFGRTLSEYETIIDDFGEIDPLKPNVSVLNLPLQIARLGSSAGMEGKGGSYDEAEGYYKDILAKNPGTDAAFFAGHFLANLYSDRREWFSVLKVLEKIEKEFPARKEIAAVRLTKANVLLDGLNRTGQAMDLFDELIQVHTDESPVYWQATVGKAKALHKQQRYEAARTLLQQVIAGKPEQAGLCAAAQWLIAAAYEAQGQWDRAIVEYRWISDKYPATPQGLSVPLHVADYYRKRGQDKLVDQALQQAVKHFQELVKKYPKTVLAGMAQEYIIYCLAFLKEWDMAIEAAGNLKQIYPGTRSDISSMLFLAQIYENIDQGDEARKVYARFIESYPEHPMVSQVKEKIAGFQ